MKIFISWSGTASRRVAECLSQWLRMLPIADLDTWVSGDDIEPGTRWHNELTEALEGTDFGILCLT